MKDIRQRSSVVFCCAFLLVSGLFAQSSGIITGIVKDDENRETIPFVNITLRGTTIGAATDEDGRYVIRNVPPGTYTIVASAVGFKTSEATVDVAAPGTTNKDFYLMHSIVELSEVLVYGASLRRERITEAPAAISLVEAKEIGRNAGHGQLPKLLESQPGVDMVQSGLYDFNINTRGFNSSLNRRLLILLDGRDLGTAFLGATEWNGLSIPLEELGRIELVRGPGSALYGANAYNGVINITSLPPKVSPGTRVIAGAGELSMFRGDIRHAGVQDRWSYRFNAGAVSGKTFSKSRKGFVYEYSGFNPITNSELTDLNSGPVRTILASGRLDYDFESGGAATAEGGIAQVENEVIVTGIGRVQVQRAQRPWARLSYSSYGLNLLLWTNGRINKLPEKSLSTGLDLYQDAWITHAEAQYSLTELEGKLFLVGGVSHRLIDIGTKRTLMQTTRHDNNSGIFAQTEYRFSDNFKTVLAARWDRSSLHESYLSPKAAVVWTPAKGHTLRATYNQAFQSPNYSELYLYVKHPNGRVAYFGNSGLKVEKIVGYELGYKGVFENSVFATFDVYFNQLHDFITDLGPGVNPAYPSPVILPGEVTSRTIWSYSNAGKVNEMGFELGVNYYLMETWNFSANASYFNFEVLEGHPLDPSNEFLVPNSPRYRLNAGVNYSYPDGLDVGLDVKYVPTFDWSAGIFKGKIPAYSLVNISVNYPFSPLMAMNLNVSNLLNRRHYQIFGGSLLGRRLILTASWSF